ncbi:MAG: group II intron maturase-specific domain-containing protein [bacterium]
MHGQPAQRPRTPSQVRCQGLQTQGNALCQPAVGATPARRIDRRTPVVRGWAHDHRHVIWAETCATRAGCVWRRVSRGATHRHPDTTGRWIANRSVPQHVGASWRVTDPTRGTPIIRVQEAVTPQRHLTITGHATPFAPQGEAYFPHRHRPVALRTPSAVRAQVLQPQQGRCPICRQGIQREETLARPHRDGHHQHNHRANLVLLPPTCHRQVHGAPASTPATSRPARGGDQA